MANDAKNSPFQNVSVWEIVSIVRMNRLLVTLCVMMAVMVALFGTLMTTKQYSATALLQITPGAAKEVNVADVMDMDVKGLYETERFYRTELSIIRTRTVAKEVLRRYQNLQYTDLDDESGPGKLISMLSVVPRERSSLIEISITHPDPERAALLATMYAEVYIDMNLESRRAASREAKTWLEQKIEEYELRVARESAEMIAFKRVHDVVDLEDEVTALSARMHEVDARYATVSTQRLLLATQLSGFDALLRQDKVAELAEVLGTPTLLGISDTYAEARTHHATIGARYGEQHSRFQESERTLTRLKDELRREVRSALEAQRVRLSLLTSEEQSLITEIESVKEFQLERQGYQSQFDQLRLAYQRSEAFLRRLSLRSDELALSSRTQLNNALLREPARTPKGAASPNMLVNLAVSLVLGFFGGVVLAFARYNLDDSLNTPDELVASLDVPLLGVVPKVDAPDGPQRDLFTHYEPRSLAAESVRGLRAMIDMQPDGSRPRRMLVTSAVGSEGKTSICVRIGIAYAQLGRRVLVIDADHHRPRVHRVFQMDNDRGVLQILRDVSDIEGATRATVVPELDVMALGPRGSDASRLFASDKFAALLDELDKRYDLVIIDTPPSAGLSDAIQLSPLMDGVVFVVRAGKVSRRIARQTVDRFRKVGSKVLGAVFNDVNSDGSGGYAYGYGYAYKQEYGYAPDDDPEDDAGSVGR